MRKLILAEARRFYLHISAVIFITISIIYIILNMSFVLAQIIGENRDMALVVFRETISFPNSIPFAVVSCYGLFYFLLPAITAQCIGVDYQLDTWKMILPRIPNRSSLLFAKIINTSIFLLVLIVLVVLFVNVLGLISSFYLGESFLQFEYWNMKPEKVAAVVEFVVFVIWYLAVAVAMTILTKSILFGTMGTISVAAFCGLIREYSPEYLSIWFAPTHFQNLIQVANDGSGPIKPTILSVSIFTSWTIVIIQIVVLFLLSFIVFKRQDFE